MIGVTTCHWGMRRKFFCQRFCHLESWLEAHKNQGAHYPCEEVQQTSLPKGQTCSVVPASIMGRFTTLRCNNTISKSRKPRNNRVHWLTIYTTATKANYSAIPLTILKLLPLKTRAHWAHTLRQIINFEMLVNHSWLAKYILAMKFGMIRKL